MSCGSKVEFFANSYNEFLEKLRDHEINTGTKYVCIRSPSWFRNDNQGPLDPSMIKGKILHWHGAVPYFHFGTKTYSCHQGKDVNLRKKQKYAEQVRKDHNSVKIQPTKKLNCPVTLTVTCMYRLSNYEIPEMTKINKTKSSNLIKKTIDKNESLGGEFVYLFTLPELSDHKHHVIGDKAAVIEPVDPRIHHKVQEYVQQGEQNSKTIKELLEVYVTTDLKQTDRTRRRFFPDRHAIHRIISNAKSNLRNNKIDMKNADELSPYSVSDEPEPETVVNVDELENGNFNLSWNGNNSTSYGELKKRDSDRKRLILECKSFMRSLESAVWTLEKEDLKEVHNNLKQVLEKASSKVTKDKSTGLPVAISKQGSSKKKAKKEVKSGTLKKQKNKLVSGQVGIAADKRRIILRTPPIILQIL